MKAKPTLLIAPEAERAIRSQAPHARQKLVLELQQAFKDREATGSLTIRDPDIGRYGHDYRVMIIPGYKVIYRRLAPEELHRQGRGVDIGYYILGLIPFEEEA